MEPQQDSTKKFSISDFKNFMAIPLSCPDSKPIFHLHVFSNPHEESEPRKPTSNFSHSITKKKTKQALELFDFILFPTLVQFWAPTINENQQEFLVTSDLPFGLSVLRKGLCVFRKRCLNHKYGVDGEGCGPPGRVFRRRFPEFCPDVGCYSGEEFELKDLAVDMGFRGYLALPVFEPDWQCCIGVLEILTVMDGSHCLKDVIEKVSDSLKEVGLSSSDVFWPFDMKKLPYNQHGNGPQEHEFALREIKKVLGVLRKTYKLPFAQTWVVSLDETSSENIISTTKMGSIEKVPSFAKDCTWFHLRKGQGLVWKALISGTCCFCRDIMQLNVKDYGLVLSARKADLGGGFAISLQSTYTGNAVYILELFLPQKAAINEQPRTFLDSLLVTMKEQFKTFKLSSGLELGNELLVEVLKVSEDDTLDSIVICQNKHDGLIVQQNIFPPLRENGASVKRLRNFPHNPTDMNIQAPWKRSKVDHSFTEHKSMEESTVTIKADFEDDIIKFQFSINSGMMKLKEEVMKRLKLPAGTFQIKYLREKTKWVPLHSDAGLVEYVSAVRSLNHKSSTIVLSIVAKNITVKALYKDDLIKFELALTAGMAELRNEVVKRLKLETERFEIKNADENNGHVLLDSDVALQKCMLLQKATMKLLILPTREVECLMLNA